MKRQVSAVLLWATGTGVAHSETIPMTADRWQTDGQVSFETRDGRQALRLGSEPGQPLQGGGATIKGLQFSTGVVEFDMQITGERDFTGPIFRQDDRGGGEIVYFRPHLNGKPDAIQYTPIVNGNLAWQIFTGPGFEAETTYPLKKWMHVRADIYRSSATISVDGSPVLHIPELKSGLGPGTLGVAALLGGSYYANFSVEPIAGYRDPLPAPQLKPLPPGSVLSWQVTPALTQAEALDRAAKGRWSGVEWLPIAVETNGIANLSKAGPDADNRHSFVARFGLRSRAAKTVTMHFGFSDKVQVFLNGRPLYAGEDLQFSRDYRFLGHVGFWDTLFLPVRAGLNQVAFVVTDDTNGGTAAEARFEPDPSITVE